MKKAGCNTGNYIGFLVIFSTYPDHPVHRVNPVKKNVMELCILNLQQQQKLFLEKGR